MLLREDDRGVLAIGQPSHAWVSGQLAREWGNAGFGSFAPHEETCLAAAQHDIGMSAWDLEPELNRRSGLPYGFTEMPLETHLELWRDGPRRLIRQSRYAAVLCSRHGQRLYELRDLSRLPDAEAEAIRAMIREQQLLQTSLCETLGIAPDDAALQRGSDLLWTWDYLSLALCLGWAPCAAREVPAAAGRTEITLRPGEDGVIHLDPWPLGTGRLSVHCEGQRLAGPYANENALRAGLAEAPWETLRIELAPERSA